MKDPRTAETDRLPAIQPNPLDTIKERADLIDTFARRCFNLKDVSISALIKAADATTLGRVWKLARSTDSDASELLEEIAGEGMSAYWENQATEAEQTITKLKLKIRALEREAGK